MTENWREEKWAEDIWYRGKVTRRRLVGWGGGAIGAMMLVPTPWRAAFGAAKSYKIGSEQPLSGAGGAGGKTAVVGLQMAVDRINNSGGINGRPVELVIADDESSPAVARQKTAKMVQEDNIDAHVGGFLSNICLACLPVWQEAKIVNMISVCLDTTLTTSACNRVSFRAHDYAPAQRSLSGRCSPRWETSGTSLMPIIPGVSRPATPMRARSERTAVKWLAPPASRLA